jgi:hypothetical protein
MHHVRGPQCTEAARPCHRPTPHTSSRRSRPPSAPSSCGCASALPLPITPGPYAAAIGRRPRGARSRAPGLDHRRGHQPGYGGVHVSPSPLAVVSTLPRCARLRRRALPSGLGAAPGHLPRGTRQQRADAAYRCAWQRQRLDPLQAVRLRSLPQPQPVHPLQGEIPEALDRRPPAAAIPGAAGASGIGGNAPARPRVRQAGGDRTHHLAGSPALRAALLPLPRPRADASRARADSRGAQLRSRIWSGVLTAAGWRRRRWSSYPGTLARAWQLVLHCSDRLPVWPE